MSKMTCGLWQEETPPFGRKMVESGGSNHSCTSGHSFGVGFERQAVKNDPDVASNGLVVPFCSFGMFSLFTRNKIKTHVIFDGINQSIKLVSA